MKTIVTHIAPDVDAVTSVWLLKRFLPGWEKADVGFVAAGKTMNDEPPDIDPEIFHVDTGMGMLDHHQTDEYTCAAKRTLEFVSKSKNSNLKSQNPKCTHHNFPDEALERLVEVVNDIDHFKEASYPNPAADFYDFGLIGILDGWKLIFAEDNQKIVELSLLLLDGIYKKFQDKVWAQEEIKVNGVEFETIWGKGMAVETVNDEVVRMAQRMGYTLAIRKDPKKGFVRIKTLPDSSADLTQTYRKLKKLDPDATWFLHASKRMLLNGSVKNPDSRPSKMTLREIVDVLKK